MLFTVKICKTNLFVAWCDDCWYESTTEKRFAFSYERAKEVTEQMKKHYQYRFEIIGEDGSVELVDFLNKKKVTVKEASPEIKKKMFVINSDILKKSGKKFCSYA
jgi:hypothetical protein